ncbi:uncharacterized protein BN500_00573 [Clostridium sp. CAG:149]|nr:uncharacterized protein BN500_00573 [Clostridium sp. CAG:149]
MPEFCLRAENRECLDTAEQKHSKDCPEDRENIFRAVLFCLQELSGFLFTIPVRFCIVGLKALYADS